MERKSPSVTSELVRHIRASGPFRTAPQGAVPYSKRIVRRRVSLATRRQPPGTAHRAGR